MKLKKSDVDNILEIYYNETDNYDEIADRCNVTVLDVANVINKERKLIMNACVIH